MIEQKENKSSGFKTFSCINIEDIKENNKKFKTMQNEKKKYLKIRKC